MLSCSYVRVMRCDDHGRFSVDVLQGVFLTLTMYKALGCVFRYASWTIAWQVLMGDALGWARSADDWNALAGAPVWKDEFRKVHYYMLRTLVVLLLWKVATLVRKSATSYLAVKFHRGEFFRRMQVLTGDRLPGACNAYGAYRYI